VPWTPLGDFPTPVQWLPELGLWVKRDDLSGKAYGGNKVRKLEFILGRALQEGRRAVWTVGATGSHQVLATCVYSRLRGLQVLATTFPQPATDHVRRNFEASQRSGARIRVAPAVALVPFLACQQILEWRRQQGCWPLRLAPGGSDEVGSLGYLDAALELDRQIRRGECPVPDFIHVAAGSCGTAAGLVAGLSLAGLPTRVVGVRVVERLVTSRPRILRLARRTLRLAGRAIGSGELERRLILLHRYCGRGYGHPTVAGARAGRLFAEAGLRLDPTYTEKAAAGMLEFMAKTGRDGGVHLFWHTLSATVPRVLDPEA
jgi:1-aminocyclopropane-1-carboxylate deaminase/D-cysteine desulfhydrase-like pyridoxal-dependent ACC family enzyme